MTVVTNLLREKIMVLGKRTLNWHERIKSSVRGQEETGKKNKNKKHPVHKKYSKKDASIEERTEDTKLRRFSRQVI